MAAEKNGYRRTMLANDEKPGSTSNNLFLGTTGSTSESSWIDGGAEDVPGILRALNVAGCVGPLGRFVDCSVN